MKDSQNRQKKQKKQKRTFNRTLQPPVKAAIIQKSQKQASIPKRQAFALKHYENNIALLLIPLTLFIIFCVLTLINNNFLQFIQANRMSSFDPVTKINPYPLVDEIPILDLSAKTAIIIDADSQVVLFSKNPELRFSMASTTKIMTALTALDYYQNNAILTVKSPFTEGSKLGLQPGEQFYFEDLLYAMLLPSANDAAITIAQNYPGGMDAFVSAMNEKAVALHLVNTHFADPTGLDDDENYTTVVDMAHLASYAKKNKLFSEVTGTKQKLITNTSRSKQYLLSNLNKLLGVGGVTGIKTGTTEGAGEVLVTSTESNGHTFIIVVMNSQDRFTDTRILMSFIDTGVLFVMPEMPRY